MAVSLISSTLTWTSRTWKIFHTFNTLLVFFLRCNIILFFFGDNIFARAVKKEKNTLVQYIRTNCLREIIYYNINIGLSKIEVKITLVSEYTTHAGKNLENA